MTSPGSTPPLDAGPSFSTELTSAPCGLSMPKDSAKSWVTSWMVTPMRPRLTLPYFTSWSFTPTATSIGIANEMPM